MARTYKLEPGVERPTATDPELSADMRTLGEPSPADVTRILLESRISARETLLAVLSVTMLILMRMPSATFPGGSPIAVIMVAVAIGFFARD